MAEDRGDLEQKSDASTMEIAHENGSNKKQQLPPPSKLSPIRSKPVKVRNAFGIPSKLANPKITLLDGEEFECTVDVS
jgi:hypothetical protein